MAQMGVACRAHGFGADHAEAGILLADDGGVFGGLIGLLTSLVS